MVQVFVGVISQQTIGYTVLFLEAAIEKCPSITIPVVGSFLVGM